jgi:16S rRNA (guanine527-N7)-methyltransferase
MNKELKIFFKNIVSEKFNLSLSDYQIEQYSMYFQDIIEWNNKFNLIAFKDEKDLLIRHFCDSLYSVKLIFELSSKPLEDTYIADLGVGAGIPGICVKIALKEIKLTSVESILKKCSFLENINNKLNINIEILNKRAEIVGQDYKYREKYDFVLSRAVCKLSPNLEIAIPLLKIGGLFLVYKTKNSLEDEKKGLKAVQHAINHLGAELIETLDYSIEGYEHQYCIAVFKKYKSTPTQFPRKVGLPEKKPL